MPACTPVGSCRQQQPHGRPAWAVRRVAALPARCQRYGKVRFTAAARSQAQPPAEPAAPAGPDAPQLGRRGLIAAAAAALAAVPLDLAWRAAPAVAAAEAVCEQFSAPAATLRQQRSGPRLGKLPVIEYPQWLFGEWEVSEKYAGNPLMVGAPVLAIHSMQASGTLVQTGDTASFAQRFYSTLPDTLNNTFRMNIGQMPEDATVADRAFNVTQAANAHGGYEVVTDSVYDPRDAPDTQRMLFNCPAGGMPQVVDLTLTSLSGEQDGAGRFCTVESYSQDQGGLTSDYEFRTTYTLVSAGHVRARQREVYYGESRGALGLFSEHEPEAVFEYELDMRRAPPPPDAGNASACVLTPKGFTQCS